MAAKEDHPTADLLVDYPTAASTTTTTIQIIISVTYKNTCQRTPRVIFKTNQLLPRLFKIAYTSFENERFLS